MTIVLVIFFIIKRTFDNGALIGVTIGVFAVGYIIKFIEIYIVDFRNNKNKENSAYIGVSVLSFAKVIFTCLSLGFFFDKDNNRSYN